MRSRQSRTNFVTETKAWIRSPSYTLPNIKSFPVTPQFMEAYLASILQRWQPSLRHEKWPLSQILQFLYAARIVLTHIQLLVKIILKIDKYCQGRKISGITIKFIKIYSRCYVEDEYSFHLVFSAIILSLQWFPNIPTQNAYIVQRIN